MTDERRAHSGTVRYSWQGPVSRKAAPSCVSFRADIPIWRTGSPDDFRAFFLFLFFFLLSFKQQFGSKLYYF